MNESGTESGSILYRAIQAFSVALAASGLPVRAHVLRLHNRSDIATWFLAWLLDGILAHPALQSVVQGGLRSGAAERPVRSDNQVRNRCQSPSAPQAGTIHFSETLNVYC